MYPVSHFLVTYMHQTKMKKKQNKQSYLLTVRNTVKQLSFKTENLLSLILERFFCISLKKLILHLQAQDLFHNCFQLVRYDPQSGNR